jgi:phosphatidylglycerophosphate synthase
MAPASAVRLGPASWPLAPERRGASSSGTTLREPVADDSGVVDGIARVVGADVSALGVAADLAGSTLSGVRSDRQLAADMASRPTTLERAKREPFVYARRGMGWLEVYQKTRKVPDLWWNAYVCRPIAAVLVAPLAGTRVTPNQITLASFAVAVVAAGSFAALPGYPGLIVAVLVFEASYVLDCADGMLARLRGTASAAGHLLDFLMDELKAFLVLSAVAWRLFVERGDPAFLGFGLLGLVCLASGVGMTTFLRRPEITALEGGAGERGAAPSMARRVLRAVESAARLAIHYPSYIWLPAVLGRMEFYLYPYVAVNGLYALRVLGQIGWRYGRG